MKINKTKQEKSDNYEALKYARLIIEILHKIK